MSVKVWLSVSLRGATNFIVVSSLRWVGGARWPSKGWRPLSCHHRDDSENDSDFVEKFLSRYLANSLRWNVRTSHIRRNRCWQRSPCWPSTLLKSIMYGSHVSRPQSQRHCLRPKQPPADL